MEAPVEEIEDLEELVLGVIGVCWGGVFEDDCEGFGGIERMVDLGGRIGICGSWTEWQGGVVAMVEMGSRRVQRRWNR